jgi:cytochrome c biogenesis protein
MSLPGGAGAVTFTGYQQWATFQVTHDPGKNVSLVAAVLVIVGLLCSMRVRRRRVWVRARPADSGRSVVEAGGLARSDADGFAEEFRALVDGLRGGREDSPGAG